MWSWTDPLREVLHALVNRILAPYIENLDIDRLNYDLKRGQVELSGLVLAKKALDKFRLPVDVLQGHMGRFTLSFSWAALNSKPVEVRIEDVYLLVAPSSHTKYDAEDDERRAQAIKMEKLESSDILLRGQSGDSESQPQGFIPSLVTKIINNLQITVKNIHIRYEDDRSPGNPFAAGITLAGFTATSVDEFWLPTFIQSTAATVRKLTRLESLTVYFDTDCRSMTGLPAADTLDMFASMIAQHDYTPDHQYILKPVTGEGKITLNKHMDAVTPKTNIDLAFEEIAFTLDGHQYRNIISLLDVYHFYLRRHQYKRYAPDPKDLAENKSRALIKFAATAVLREVHERNRRWTFAYMKEVGENRRAYMSLFRKKYLNQLSLEDKPALEKLEHDLSYEDIQLYRHLTRRQLRKDIKEGKLQKQKPQATSNVQTGVGWGLNWLLGYGSNNTPEEPVVQTGNVLNMTDEQLKELYAAIDYDQKTDEKFAGEIPAESLKLRVSAQLEHGSLALKSAPRTRDIISLVSDRFKVEFVERPNNFETIIALGGFKVFDNTVPKSIYPQIVRLKEQESALMSSQTHEEDPFLYLKFENKPLDERADSALTLRLRYMEIIYHRGYVEAIYNFFRPPESQLESVDALLGAASQTLEGLRQETRAGLEYALNSHKTIDIKMDMQAPIIIVPEDVTSENNPHLVLDAGHIAIESELAAKDARQNLDKKLNETYDLEDWKDLESHMYDRFSVTLKAAQFLLGPNLNSCLRALDTSSDKGSLHIVERINIQLSLHNSILPSRVRLPSNLDIPRVKISGRLPSLRVNISDTKYKALMKFVDTAIPKFDREESISNSKHIQVTNDTAPDILKPAGFFLSDQLVDYPLEDGNDDNSSKDKDSFMDAEDDSSSQGTKPQNLVLSFEVDRLEALVSKADSNGTEMELGDLRLDNFRLSCNAEDEKITVGIVLRSITATLSRAGHMTVPLLTSREDISVPEGHLLTISYVRIQEGHPEFMSKHDGFDQDIQILVSTIIFHACPEPVIALYDFIMTTFVPERSLSPPQSKISTPNGTPSNDIPPDSLPRPSKIRVNLSLASVQVLLINNSIQLATLALSTAHASVKVYRNTLKVDGVLGSLSLFDDSDSNAHSDDFKKILSIEGDNLANFGYQTFDPEDKTTFKGVNSLVTLKSGALRLIFLEGPYHDLYRFLIKFAKLKGLYDAAAAAAAERAAEIQRMQFDIFIRSPILIYPQDATESDNTLVMKLGEISARNFYDETTVRTEASLQGIQLTSEMIYEGKVSQMNIIEKVQINTKLVQKLEIDRRRDLNSPDSQMTVEVSDVKLQLNRSQYCFLINALRSVLKVVKSDTDGLAEVDSTVPNPPITPIAPPSGARDTSMVNLQPEIQAISADGVQPWTSLSLELLIGSINLHLYDETAKWTSDLQTAGIVKFAINDTRLRYKTLTDGAAEAELVLKSFTITNTRSGSNRFREIIPAAKHNRNQFMILYTTSGGPEPSSLAIITIDSPKIIFTVDPLFALLDFFSATNESLDSTNESNDSVVDKQNQGSKPNGLDFRVDLHDVIISVLETDVAADTQAIQLSIKQVLLSQQAIMALTVNRLGMSLLRMDKPSEAVRFLDDLDLTFTMDNRQIVDHQVSNLELTLQTIIFRASYRDIILISSIVNKAVELFNRQSEESSPKNGSFDSNGGGKPRLLSNRSTSLGSQGRGVPPQAVTSKEHFKATFDGFRLVLIGDIYELPIVHLSTKAFELSAQDWSADLHAHTSVDTSITYWNLANSHWEPLIDPWKLSVSVGRQGASGGLNLMIVSQDCLNVNISSTLIELALSMLDAWQKEGDRVLRKARGSYAPYRIRNRTGGPINVWSDINGPDKNSPIVKIASGETIDWRFDDWKTMREHVSVTGHNSLGVQFISKPWEQVHNIAVGKEGECIYTLRPKTQKVSARLLCDVALKGHVKVVTFRSTFLVKNNTLFPLELMLIDYNGQPASAVEKIAPDDDYALPIDKVTESRITVRPDQGFGYKWSNPLQWEELTANRTRLFVCRHTQSSEPAWRLQACAEFNSNDTLTKRYPKLTLHLRAPIEVENLLPYNIQYNIYDKELEIPWNSYLRQGGLMPVHCVEPSHMIVMSITIQDTCFKSSNFAVISAGTSEEYDIDKQLTLKDTSGRSLNLRLNTIKHENSGGAFRVQIYSPFIVVNKTGLPFQFLSLRSTRAGVPQEVAGERESAELSKPTPFLLSHSHSKGHEFVLKVGGSGWSQTLSFEPPSAEMALSLPTAKDTENNIGISWTLGQGRYELSKVITIAPRFLIKNNMDQAIQFREKGMPPAEDSILQPGTRGALRYTRRSPAKLLTVAYSGLNAKWSTPINIQDIGVIHFRLYPLGTEDMESSCLVRADIAVEGPTIHVSINKEDDSWPFILENASDYDFTFCQIDESHPGPKLDEAPGSYVMHQIASHSTLDYAWDFPAFRNKKLLLTFNGKERSIDIMEIGDLPPFKFPTEQGHRAVSLDIRADGSSQRLAISNYTESTSLYKPKRQSSFSSSSDTLGSFPDSFEIVTQDQTAILTIKLDLAGLGVSLINRDMIEVVYMSLRELNVEYSRTATAQSIAFSCFSIQMDNQLYDAIYPVALQPSPLPKRDGMTTPPPAIQMSIVYLHDQAHGVLFVKYASILLQSLTIQLDEDFLLTLYDMSNIPSVNWKDNQPDVLILHPTEIPEPSKVAEGQTVYFENLELQPVKLIVSFMTTPRVDADEKSNNTSDPFAFIMRGLLNYLGNVNDAPFRLNALIMKDLRQTIPDLRQRIMYHYRQEVMRQAFRLMGFADFVGNPVGLFENISSGVMDAFYEPWAGVVVNGMSREFGIGVVKGVSSLLKKSVYGVSDSFSKVTNSLGKGLATATFDAEWDNRRRSAQRRNKPRHILDGVASGAEAFASSVGSGVEGLVMKPIEGAQVSGARGFFSGIGKGVVGLVAKPAVGIMDLASNLGAGVRNTTTVFDEPARERVRLARHIPPDGVLTPYSAREALGQYWMKDLDQGSYRNEKYVAHYDLPGGDNTIMLTMSKVISFRSNRLRLEWELPFSLIQGINIEDNGILFQCKSGRDRDRFVYIADTSSKVWFFSQIERVVKSYNTRRSTQSK